MSRPLSALAETIVSTRTIGENAAWTILGRVGPMMVAVILTPELIRQLGPDRWGIFSIALTLIGVFGLFDFGIGRAITRNIAEGIALGTVAELASQIKTSLAALLAFGLTGTLVMAALVEYWIRSTLKIPSTLTSEVRLSLYLLCVAVPLVLLGSGMWGILSAYQNSKAATMISTPILIMYYAGPLLVFRLSHSLVPVIALIVGLRLLVTILFWRLCKKLIPQLKVARINARTLKPVFRVSGWMTISNLLFPVLTYVDRFMIASVVSAAAVGYYSTAGDLITRLYLIPTAITGSIFPAVAASKSAEPERVTHIVRRGTVLITTILFPISVGILLFGKPALQLWLGMEIASHIEPLLMWFALGLIFAAADTLITGVIDSLGFPKVNSIFSIVELVTYVPLMALLLRVAGLRGAAVMWLVRAVVDLCVRLVLLCRVFPSIKSGLFSLCFAPAVAASLTLLCLIPNSIQSKICVLLLSGIIYCVLVISWSFSSAERLFIQDKVLRFVNIG